ncbi:MAG: MarR family transcriptional regulator [Clostridia bacterium]|nr:MarR family transcriptional regulator [Clostridia bacterium]
MNQPPVDPRHGPGSNAMDTEQRLILNLRDLGHTLRFLYEGKASQKRILILLLESGGMTQRDLTERTGVQPGTASEVILKMEAAGLITRRPNAMDRRTTDVRLTEAGMATAREAIEQRRNRHRDMFDCLSDPEMATLLALTEKLNENWSQKYQRQEKGNRDDRRRSEGRRHGRGDEIID